MGVKARFLVLSVAVVVGSAVGAVAGLSGGSRRATGFVPLQRVVLEPYADAACLDNCHGVVGFGAGSNTGILRQLYVDAEGYRDSTHGKRGITCLDCHVGADPNTHPRTGYPRVDCRACHAVEPPEGVFPPDAVRKLSEKGIQPPGKDKWKGAGWETTAHARAWEAGDARAPFCPQCHTAHAIRNSLDPQATTHRDNLAATCGVCHAGQVEVGGVGAALARFRVSAHGKGDASQRYAVTECLSCHTGEGAHGEEELTGQRCPACHRVPEEGAGVGSTGFHVMPQGGRQPAALALAWIYGVGFWGVAATVGLLAVVAVFAHLYRRRDDAG